MDGFSEIAKGAPPTKTLKRASRLDFPASASSAAPSNPSNQTLSPSKASEHEMGSGTGAGPRRKKGLSPLPSQGNPGQVQTKRKPTLIRNLGGAGPAKGLCSRFYEPSIDLILTLAFSFVPCTSHEHAVVGEMKWNPVSLHWEGNDAVLKDFDSTTGTSTRPALITHLTGSSIGSPVGSFAAGARVVGTMVFDPARMCWVSTLPPEEDEPDVFAHLADDENEEDWERQGGTIRASALQQQASQPSSQAPSQEGSGSSGDATSLGPSLSRARPFPPSRRPTTSAASSAYANTLAANTSESESDRCSRASIVCDVDDAFWDTCRVAEERHKQELKGWIAALPPGSEDLAEDRSYLYEIRALATRQY